MNGKMKKNLKRREAFMIDIFLKDNEPTFIILEKYFFFGPLSQLF